MNHGGNVDSPTVDRAVIEVEGIKALRCYKFSGLFWTVGFLDAPLLPVLSAFIHYLIAFIRVAIANVILDSAWSDPSSLAYVDQCRRRCLDISHPRLFPRQSILHLSSCTHKNSEIRRKRAVRLSE